MTTTTMMEDSVTAARGREQETAAAVSVKRLERGKKKLLRVVTKPFRRWLIVIYKQVLALVRQAFKMVTDLEKTAGGVVGGKDNVIRDLIEKTRIWLVDQIGKKFPSEKARQFPQKSCRRRWRRQPRRKRKEGSFFFVFLRGHRGGGRRVFSFSVSSSRR
jgi:hypothetical protein